MLLGIFAIVMLGVMEVLLSVDNSIVLATKVIHLPENEQKKALNYGIIGSYVIRVILIFLATIIVKIWWIKLVGGLYLLWLVFSHFIKKQEDGDSKSSGKGFWATVVTVQIVNLVFSVDNLLASVGVSNSFWVILFGSTIGIIAMGALAQVFLKLLHKMPELETGAYILILVIGIKMILETFHIEVPEAVLYSVMGLVLIGTAVISKNRSKKGDK